MNIDGLILESKYPQYQHLMKGPLVKTWRDGFPVDEQKILILQFDRYICFVDEMSRDQEWTPDDREYVANGLEWQLNDPKFRDMWVHEPVKPVAPWPTYDQTHHKQVHTVAQAVGLVNEALAYELHGRPGGPRPDVVKHLQAAQGVESDEQPAQDTGAQVDDELYADV